MLSNIFPPSVVSLPDAAGNYNPFPTYNFSGSLRPSYPLSQRRAVPDKIRHPDYASHGIPKSEQVRGTRMRDLETGADTHLGIRRKKQDQDPHKRRAGWYAQGLQARA
jgi:hypothetical protein